MYALKNNNKHVLHCQTSLRQEILLYRHYYLPQVCFGLGKNNMCLESSVTGLLYCYFSLEERRMYISR